VGVSKVGGIFVHKSRRGRFDEKSTKLIREKAMQEALSAAQEAEVKELAEAIAQAASAEFLQLARALVGSGSSPFGKTEFAVRDILLQVGAKAYEQYLAQKKTATRGPA
jgi:parvulin-like peptidyl-prolyl isomerase